MQLRRLLSANKQLLGVVVSLGLGGGAYLLAIGGGLAQEACLVFGAVLFAVTWWAFRVVPPAYTSLGLVLFLVLSGVSEPEEVFGFWTGPTAWLMIGAFLIARAVTESGLARRVALLMMRRGPLSYGSLVTLIYLLNAVLAVIIPLPFPRAFIIMALVGEVAARTDVDNETRAALGFAVFASSVPASMILLTAESVLNPVTAEFAGGLAWLDWFTLMFVPSVLAGVLMRLAHRWVFRPEAELTLGTAYIDRELEQLGPLSQNEWKTVAWVALAGVLWVTDAWHGLHPGWVALGAAVGLSLPWVGDVLRAQDLTEGVDWSTLLFATGTLAIGTAGTSTGLAGWLVSVVLPESLPASPLVLLMLAGVAGLVLHLFIGSVLATLAMLVPAVVAVAAARGMPSFAPALIIYTTAVMGFALPFHNLMILVGAGKVGGFDERHTLRFFPAQVVVTLLVVGAEVLWWRVLGRI